VTRANPTPSRLNLIDLKVPLRHATAVRAIADRASVRETDRAEDDLVSLRSQELRAPLLSIVSLAELIEAGELTDDQRHLYAGILLRAGRRMTALIDNALALQGLETGRREMALAPVDLRALIQRAVRGAGEDDLRPIAVRVPEQLPLVSADAEAILEVLANFLSNARRFSPDGGAITVAARLAGDMVEVSIEDRGVGVGPEALGNLFRKFYRADSGVRRRGPGAGLGLAMNHRIIEAHGGQVEADSKGPGTGARFQFTLPISRPRRGSGDVLIVEDDAGFASLMKAEFAVQGLSTVRAADAETAEHMLKDMTPRAIILALSLPGLQGEDFLARMQASDGTRLLVVVITAKNLGPAEISALETAGAIAVLPKEAGAPQAAVALIAEALGIDPVRG
jgi:nitrogen-specific signal transduction histidine kinase